MTIYSASATAPVNIATLKYWGKRDASLNLPTNSSISVTLAQKDLRTLTTASASPDFTSDKLWLNGAEELLASKRSQACLGDLRALRRQLEEKDSSLPKLSTYSLHIVSENNFPTAAGLASLAAGFAALIVAIARLYKLPQDMSELSKIARQGSGSACRSLFGGFVAWEMGTEKDGSDLKAVQVAPLEHWSSIRAAILVVSDDKKDTPLTLGMQQTVATLDLFAHRINEVVPARYKEMQKTILDKNFAQFAELTMKDLNSFHAVCLDLFPPIFYLNDTSKKIIKLVHKLNEIEGVVIAAYTFDAGPNAVIYYEQQNEEKVLGFLYKIFSKVPQGWKSTYEGYPHEFAYDEELYQNISRVILTEIGPGPLDTEELLINEQGLPK